MSPLVNAKSDAGPESFGSIGIEAIPQDLKDLSQWVGWREETRGGRPTKIPVNVHTGGNAAVDRPETWAAFAVAIGAASRNGNKGIGFVLKKVGPYTVIDLDGVRNPETGEIEQGAMAIVTRLNSYTEISPSGRGVHIWVKGKLPPGRRRKGNFEAYDSDRYITLTGHHLLDTPTTIEDRHTELTTLHREIFGNPETSPLGTSSGSAPTLDLSDHELIDLAHRARNGAKFERLWRGDARGYGSPSEVTAALLNALVFYCGPDPERVDRLFRQSGLMRKKWDRPQSGSTWGRLEIDKAISRAKEFHAHCQRTKASEHKEDQIKTTTSTSTTSHSIPVFPQEVIVGAAGAFARCYASYLETPEAFLFMDYLTLLGHLVSDRITLASEIAPQPRLYTINLGESANTRKTTSIYKTTKFFLDVVNPDDINLIGGAGSGEGLAKSFNRHHRAILVLDELKALVQKCRIEGSVLLPCINTLFELNQYHSLTKFHEIKIDNAELCLLAASTLDTYRNIFTPQFLDIGFVNRLFIVIGGEERRFAIPHVVPEKDKEVLRADLRKVLQFVGGISQGGRYALPLTWEAIDIFESWYFYLEHSSCAKRLDTYGHRLMVLLAVNEMQTTITPEIAEKVVALLNYQLAARKFADPVDADNAIARLEERIRRILAFGTLSKRELERRGNKARVGIWLWDTAINNLRRAQELIWDHKAKTYSLAPE
jgi:hypothetical protein